MMGIPHLDCMVVAAQLYALPPRVLPSIQAVEGGAVGLVHRNNDNSADLGLMQVNTRWIRPLARILHLPEDAVLERLINDACFNINAAGLIIRGYLAETHGDLLRAVAYYHSHTHTIGMSYRIRVENAAIRLFVMQAERGATTDEAATGTSEAAEHVSGSRVPTGSVPMPTDGGWPAADTHRSLTARHGKVQHAARSTEWRHVTVQRVTVRATFHGVTTRPEPPRHTSRVTSRPTTFRFAVPPAGG